MLTISPINNIQYYVDLAKDDYYLSGGEPSGIWYGLGARYLSLENEEVEQQAYINLLEGFSVERKPLVQNAGSPGRRCGWDLTFSAPKSVSLIWARGSNDLQREIQIAQEQAVKAAVGFIERNAAITRRDTNGVSIENVAGLIVATFEHCTSRAQDFQLHTHALVCNAAPRMDGSWGSIDSRKLYSWQKASGAIYRAELACRLIELGFEVESDGDSFHIQGVDKKLCDHFSKRSNVIESELKKVGVASSASKIGNHIKINTRESKRAIDREVLFGNWKCELDTLGFDASNIVRVQRADKSDKRKIADADLIIQDVTSVSAVFRPQDVYYQMAVGNINSGLNANKIESMARAALNERNIVSLKATNVFDINLTTDEVISLERSMLKKAKVLGARKSITLSDVDIKCAISQAESDLGFKFDDEQEEAIYSALYGSDLNLVQGSAGAGKTTLLLAARHAYENSGYTVQGACIAKRAADNLYAESGIKSSTVASLISAIDSGASPLKNLDVLVVDEAGQLGSVELQQLLNSAVDSGCKIILTGEDKQLDAINRGGALRYLSRPEVIGTQRIETIRRQRAQWSREMVANFRDGKSGLALQSLQDHGCLHWGDNGSGAKQQLVKHWHTYQKENPEKYSLILAQRWEDVKELSSIVRAIHIAEGRVGNENISVKCSIAEKQFNVEFSCGDRIKFCKNDYRNLKVSNGTLGTITEIKRLDNDVRFTVKVDDKRNISFLASEYADEIGTNLTHAYALTIYSSQGVTVDGNTFIYYNGGMGRANTYVAASRHKDEVHIFCNAKEIDEYAELSQAKDQLMNVTRLATLADLMSKDNYSRLAIEHLPQSEFSTEFNHQLQMG